MLKFHAARKFGPNTSEVKRVLRFEYNMSAARKSGLFACRKLCFSERLAARAPGSNQASVLQSTYELTRTVYIC